MMTATKYKKHGSAMLKSVLRYLDQNPGATAKEVAYGLGLELATVSSGMWSYARTGHLKRIKQDGYYRHYPKNWLTPKLEVAEKPKPITEMLTKPEFNVIATPSTTEHIRSLAKEFYWDSSGEDSLKYFINWLEKGSDQ